MSEKRGNERTNRQNKRHRGLYVVSVKYKGESGGIDRRRRRLWPHRPGQRCTPGVGSSSAVTKPTAPSVVPKSSRKFTISAKEGFPYVEA